MSRPVLAALLLLLAPAVVVAQTDDTKPAATQQDPEAAYQQLAKDLTKAIDEWRTAAQDAVKKAQEEGGPIPAIAMTPPTKEFIDRARALADEYAGKDDAVRFLTFICKNATNERNAVKKAVKTLLDHAESTVIGSALDHLPSAAFGGAKADVFALLDAVVERNKDVNCQGQALVVRGTLRLQMAETDEDRSAAAADLQKVASVATDADILVQAKDALFELENLQVGCTAPDIVAKDTDGVDFKLSDYRGKVVLLDFWGFW
jgi:hypothetical protein